MLDRSHEKLAGLFIERRGAFERLRRCDDLFGQMLLTGKIKSIDRQIEARRDTDRNPEGEKP